VPELRCWWQNIGDRWLREKIHWWESIKLLLLLIDVVISWRLLICIRLRVIDLYGAIRQDSLPTLEKAQIQRKLGAAWEAYPNSEQAEIFYLGAFELCRSTGEPLQAAEMKMAIGDVQRDAKKLEAASTSYQEALGLYQDLSNRSGIVKVEGRIRRLRYLMEGLETSEPFEVMTVDRAGVVIDQHQYSVQYFREILPGHIELEMVSIPSGEFLMGSPNGEGFDNEKPQHLVNVPEFFLGKYSVTQEQWRAIALQTESQVTKELDPEPSYFSGSNKPVSHISGYDAVEFCARLSNLTDKNYRLPSEAEWEYACRAGTITPFCFGSTITTELANHSGYIYADEQQGLYRGETTPVNQFRPNAFGLYDVHANVWEWCADHWRNNYEGAPRDGSAWINSNQNSLCVLHGGSWFIGPSGCRSAFRNANLTDNFNDDVGFRVVYAPARI
jgi:formylglycine-generating enzyme required for sulfatase activity